MKRHNVILESNVEPENKNILWLHGKKLKKFGKDGWEDITDIEALNQALNTLGEHSDRLENLADNEDITSVNDVLKFANKDYSPASYSGLGRVYLRKNFVDGKNVLTQDMITKENTIYVIRYDYELNNETITIPDGCVLKFDGGKLSNGSIKGDFVLDANAVTIFDNINIIGNVNTEFAQTEWFNDNINICCKYFEIVRLSNKTYQLQSLSIEADYKVEEIYGVSKEGTMLVFSDD